MTPLGTQLETLYQEHNAEVAILSAWRMARKDWLVGKDDSAIWRIQQDLDKLHYGDCKLYNAVKQIIHRK